jgi:outer membrane protein OmpA-like peptidoglycan-associated protein
MANEQRELTPIGKILTAIKRFGVYILLIAGAGIGYYLYSHTAKSVATASQKIENVEQVATFNEDKVTTKNKVATPAFNTPTNNGTSVKWQVMAWNAQMPLMFANGGIKTSKGSLFEQAGINCEIVRQDDCGQTVKDFQENAGQLTGGKTDVPLIISFMGDGIPGFSAALEQIKKNGKGHRPIVFYGMGRSNGEDCFWGPGDWKDHPEHAKGKGVLGVVGDGDINIVLHWAHDNDVPINSNEKVWDSGALNIIPCTDYNKDLCSKILTGYHENRDVVVNGKTVPGQKHTLECDAFTTWTPADVTIAKKKGGFARLASTADYTMQMPCMSIIDGAWADAHPDKMQAIIKALGIAGDQIRSFPDALDFASRVSAKVYNENDANFWKTYYLGSNETDKKANKVYLGGSQSFNLADAATIVGMGNETKQIDRYKVTYEMFGSILTKLYPDLMKGMAKYDDIVDFSYLKAVINNNSDLAKGKTEGSTATYASGNIVTDQVSKKAYNIKFGLNISTIDKSSYSMLDDIFNSTIQSENALTVFVYGHTDDLGDAKDGGTHNQSLSEDRANAVKNYLISKGLPENRIKIKGCGSSEPITATNGDKHDVRNRCVEIIQGH